MAIDNSIPRAVSAPAPAAPQVSFRERTLRLDHARRMREGQVRFLLKALELSDPEQGVTRVLTQLHGQGKLLPLNSNNEGIRYFVFSPNWISEENVVQDFEPECKPGPESRAKSREQFDPTVLLLRSPDEPVLGPRTEDAIRAWLGRHFKVIVLEYPGEGDSAGIFRTKSVKSASAVMLRKILGDVPRKKCIVEGVGGGVIPATYVAEKCEVALLLRNPDEIDEDLVSSLHERIEKKTLRVSKDKDVAEFGQTSQFLKNIRKLKVPLALLLEDGMTGKGGEMRSKIYDQYLRSSFAKKHSVGIFAPLFDQPTRQKEQRRQLERSIAAMITQTDLLRAEGAQLRAEAAEAERLCPPGAQLPEEFRKDAYYLSFVRRDLEVTARAKSVISTMLEAGRLRIEDLNLLPLQYSSSWQFSDALNKYLRLLEFFS